MASQTVVIPHSCKHEGQDQIHGRGNRVMNMTKDEHYRCTVCLGTIQPSRREKAEVKDEKTKDKGGKK